jgi:hypothetical protein
VVALKTVLLHLCGAFFFCLCVSVCSNASFERQLYCKVFGNSLIQTERGMAGGGRRGFISKDFIFVCVLNPRNGLIMTSSVGSS